MTCKAEDITHPNVRQGEYVKDVSCNSVSQNFHLTTYDVLYQISNTKPASIGDALQAT